VLHVAAISGNESCLKLLLEQKVDILIRNIYGHTVLHQAMIQNVDEAVPHLLASGADISARDNRGNTPLHFASRVRVGTLELLLKAGADISARTSWGLTALMCVHEAAIANVLLKNGADCLEIDKEGNIAVHHALFSEVYIDDCWKKIHKRSISVITSGKLL